MNLKNLVLATPFLLSSVVSIGQVSGVTPADLLKPLKDSWPTYNGDYSGRRYSALTQVNRTTVKQLTLAWMSQMTPGVDSPTPTSGGGGRPTGR
jgi:alcohol dehydrogenase (cytochrome c)